MDSTLLTSPFPVCNHETSVRGSIWFDELNTPTRKDGPWCVNPSECSSPDSQNEANLPILGPFNTTSTCASAEAADSFTRRRGRPRKTSLGPPKESWKSTPKRLIMKVSRALHNNSARRSRDKFHTAIEELWKQVPQDEQLGFDGKANLSRSEKLQITTSYIRKLRNEI